MTVSLAELERRVQNRIFVVGKSCHIAYSIVGRSSLCLRSDKRVVGLKVTSMVFSKVMRSILFLSVVVAFCLSGCDRRPRVYAGIDETKGNAESSQTIDPHKTN